MALELGTGGSGASTSFLNSRFTGETFSTTMPGLLALKTGLRSEFGLPTVVGTDKTPVSDICLG